MNANEKDLLALRVAARAKLADPTRPPSLIVIFCHPNWQNGEIVQPPLECDARLCRIGDREIRREEGETYDAFEQRVQNELPVAGPPVMAIMVPPESESQPGQEGQTH